jgi:hypothetical protein
MPHALVQTIVVDPKVRSLCARPYPGHPKGCPNVGQRDTCPPRARLLQELLDLDRPVYAVWSSFDLGVHIERMRLAHPVWSDRQLVNCLYWQAGARKVLRGEIDAFLREHPELARPGLTVSGCVLTCPEACGVNVTATMATLGVELQWPPKTITYQVALAGFPTRSVAEMFTPKKEHRPGEQLGLLEE